MSVRILQGDVREQLRTLPDESVQVVCTSPPYFRLRSYLPVDHPDKHLEIGSEQTPAEFVAGLVAVFEEVRRVMRPDGVLFVNLADSYAGSGKVPTGHNGIGGQAERQGFRAGSACADGKVDGRIIRNRDGAGGCEGVKPKSLMLVPQRFAIAMQDAGWIVRDEICWAKKNPMPESAKDRCTKAWEPIYMFTKQGRYFWDQEAVRQPLTDASVARLAQPYAQAASGYRAVNGAPDGDRSHLLDKGANLRNVWHLGPEPSKEAHYASFVTEIPRRCILAATSEKGGCAACGAPWTRIVERQTHKTFHDHSSDLAVGQRQSDNEFKGANYYANYRPPETTGWAASCKCDAGPPVPQTVLDPFAGTFTTCLVAERLGRNSIGVELSPDYVSIGKRRLYEDCPMFSEIEVAG